MFTAYGFYYYSCIFISKIRNTISCEANYMYNSFFISVKVCQVLMAIQMMTAMMMIVMTIKATHPMMIQYAGVRPHHQQETHPTPAPGVHCENLGHHNQDKKESRERSRTTGNISLNISSDSDYHVQANR